MRTDYLCRGLCRTVSPGKPLWIHGLCNVTYKIVGTIYDKEEIE